MNVCIIHIKSQESTSALCTWMMTSLAVRVLLTKTGLQLQGRHQSQCCWENGGVVPHSCSEKLKQKKNGNVFYPARKDESSLTWNVTIFHSFLWLHTFKQPPPTQSQQPKRTFNQMKSLSYQNYQNLSEETMLFPIQIKKLSRRRSLPIQNLLLISIAWKTHKTHILQSSFQGVSLTKGHQD